jgi:hypothetical protein
MKTPLIPGAQLPSPQYRNLSRADLAVASATIRAFRAQGWVEKCKSTTMSPIHMVKKDPKPGINPDTGLPYPPRRRLTLDYRKVNSVVQVDAARIPDVKETVQSLRVLAGESQRQVNARRDGTRKSIHDHDAAASWNLNADKLLDL